MDEEAYLEYLDNNYAELIDEFLEQHPAISDMFDEYCFETWESYEAGRTDYVKEIYGDDEE